MAILNLPLNERISLMHHSVLTDLEFERRFQACDLAPIVFDHEAHLRLAWIHIKQYGLEKAEANMNVQLLNYVQQLGAFDKYNKTLTTAAVKAVFHFSQRASGEDFYDLIKEFPRLKHNFKELMEAHYSFDIYDSMKAKVCYLEPDKAPFN